MIEELEENKIDDKLAKSGNLIDVRNLHIDFNLYGGSLSIIKGVSFSIVPGTTVALVGESGAGKSVISQAIMGLLPNVATVKSGQILFDDPSNDAPAIDLTALDRNSREYRQIRGGRISMIFQEPMTSLSPFHTIGDQISEALFLHRSMDKRTGNELVVDMLRICGFPRPEEAVNRYPFELSGGLRQRAMIAMALVCHPALLIADEPTTALDVSVQAQILKLMKNLQSELQMAILIITHDLGVVANIADEVVVLFHGEIMESGSSKDIFKTPKHKYLRALLSAVPHFDMKPGERLVPLREIKRHHKELSTEDRNTQSVSKLNADEPVLRIDRLVKSFTTNSGGFFGFSKPSTINAVDDISFRIQAGESLGLVGESGCGKTTLSKLITRALRPDSGQMIFKSGDGDVDIGLANQHDLSLSRSIGMVFQDPFGSLNPRMTVFDIIREPLIIHSIGDKSDHKEKVTSMMEQVGLDPRFLNRYPHSFSGGQRQRISLARSLTLNPNLLILDEPASALDVSIQAQILNLLKDMQIEFGLTYLFISHNLAVVDYVADRILVMCKGKIVESAPREVLFRNPVHHYTRSLMSAVPYADLDRKLDFEKITQTEATDPATWPKPYAFSPGQQMEMISLGDDHLVLAEPGITQADIQEIE